MARLVSDNFDVELRIVKDENKDLQNEIPEKPIEGEKNIGDHINHKPVNLSFDFTVAGDDSDEIRDDLEKMREADEVFDYYDVKELKIYKNMGITSLSIRDIKDVGNGFVGSIQLKQVRVVEQETTIVNLGKDPETGTQAQTNPEEEEKRSPETEETDEDTVDIRQSFLTKLTGG